MRCAAAVRSDMTGGDATAADPPATGGSDRLIVASVGTVRERIGYLHIPKAAGSSGTEALVRAANAAQRPDGRPVTVCPAVFDRSLYGGFDDFASFDDTRRWMVFEGPVEGLADFDVVAGHYNAQSLCNGRSTDDLVVLFREPRARLISLYTYWRSWTEAEHAGWGGYDASRHAVDLDWADFLVDESIAPQIDNVAARLVLGTHRLIPRDSFIDPRDLDEVTRDATAALMRFGHVDVIENGAECWQRLAQWSGLVLDVARRNETPPVVAADVWARAHDADVVEALRLRTAVDLELWISAARRHGRDRRGEAERAEAIAVDKLSTVSSRAVAGGVPTDPPAAMSREGAGTESASPRWRRWSRGS